MSLAPSPSASRGDLTLQPSFFTSSLFVLPFRADIQHLIVLFSAQYPASNPDPAPAHIPDPDTGNDTGAVTQPFALFKKIWDEQGWTWVHLKVFDARARETFLRVVCRLFVGAYLPFDFSIKWLYMSICVGLVWNA